MMDWCILPPARKRALGWTIVERLGSKKQGEALKKFRSRKKGGKSLTFTKKQGALKERIPDKPNAEESRFSATEFPRATFHFLTPLEHSPEYVEYLRSEHWFALRETAFNRANRKCEACGNVGTLHGHHLLYRRPLSEGVVDDIMALCTSCHHRVHDWLQASGNRLSKLTREATRGVIIVLRSMPAIKPAPVAVSAPAAMPALLVKGSERCQKIRAQLMTDQNFAHALATMNRKEFSRYVQNFITGKPKPGSLKVNAMILFDKRVEMPVFAPKPKLHYQARRLMLGAEARTWATQNPEIQNSLHYTSRIAFKHVVSRLVAGRKNKFRSRAINAALDMYDRHWHQKNRASFEAVPEPAANTGMDWQKV